MKHLQTVYDQNNVEGEFDDTLLSEDIVSVQFGETNKVYVPSYLFQLKEDGIYYLPFSFSQIDEQGHIVIPVIQESATVAKQVVDGAKVKVTKTVQHEDHIIDEVVYQDHVNIERIAANTFVDEAESVQYEGDTITIPIYEEVLVVEKRLRLKETIHITRTRVSETVTEQVTLRKESIDVQRIDDNAS